MSDVRVRFAPSPTGYLHIGSARTALYNWLYARKTGGKMILRIEDTDAERSTQESLDTILEGLKWLGLDWDIGPYYQSAHIGEHAEAAKKLLLSGSAYRCFCTKEELEKKREGGAEFGYDGTCRKLSEAQSREKADAGIPFVVRFKTPKDEGAVVFEDMVYGRIEKAHKDIEDFIVLRSDGSPLYLLSNVVDDIRDGITHVIRGQDGLGNTPRQVLIYTALGAKIPTFAHLPLTLDSQKAKISKRKHGEAVAIHFYKEKGFLPWALCNFLAMLGWSSGDDREIFSREELVEAFSLERINKSNSVFNLSLGDPKFFTDPKALSVNAHYIKTLPIEEVGSLIKPVLENAGLWDAAYEGEKRGWYLETVNLIRERFHTLNDFAEAGRAYFSDEFDLEDRALERNIVKFPQLRELLPELSRRIAAMEGFETHESEELMRKMCEELGVKPGVLINGVRTAVTGQLAGPSMFEALKLIGKEKVVARLANVDRVFEAAAKLSA
ncbi:glutamate--tRNA ligase [bacterium]|nr:MAG: glutamate--tRNA ligase [bacterium]